MERRAEVPTPMPCEHVPDSNRPSAPPSSLALFLNSVAAAGLEPATYGV